MISHNKHPGRLRQQLQSQTLKCLLLAFLLFSQASLALHHHDDNNDLLSQLESHECSACSQLQALEHSAHSPPELHLGATTSDSINPAFYFTIPSRKFYNSQARAPPLQ